MNDSLATRIPPQDLAAERAVVGGVLRDPDAFHDVAAAIGPGSFYLRAHQVLFEAMIALAGAGRPIDLVTLHDHLRAVGHGAEVGGAGYLAEVWDAVPTGANTVYHAGIVREKAALRSAVHVANELIRAAHADENAAEVISRAAAQLSDANELALGGSDRIVAVPDAVRAALQRIDDRVTGTGKPELGTGFVDLDDLLGGLRGGQMVVVGARPGGGKTALAACLAANAAMQGTPVLFFSMEMPASQIGERFLAMGSGVPLNRIVRDRHLAPEDYERLAAVAAPGGLGTVPVYVDDAPGQTAARLVAATRREVRRRGVGLVVIDYLQLMRPENPGENRTQQVGLMSRRVKHLARSCDVPVVCLCQLNRGVENRGADAKPRLADIRESGDIEADADVVLLLHPQPDQPKANDVWLIDVGIAKQRNGPVGDVTLAYRRSCVRFENAARS
ncbi:replicative DNA helicase [Gemmata sp.]|uniref:replicative DNA helicase n=1 Tax=Gemmata sp. TaxID=1914242 RepID=UPI003F7097F8